MNNLCNDVQVCSSKIVEFNFINIYEISGYEKSMQFQNEVTFKTTLIKDSLVELLVSLKLKDKQPSSKNVKTETIFRILLLSKFNIDKSKFEKVSNDDNNVKIDEDVLKKMLNMSLTLISAKLSILSSLMNFGSLQIPVILDADKIMVNHNE
jgi:hypothetical protein